jgi:CRP-like cAMP-binding protein
MTNPLEPFVRNLEARSIIGPGERAAALALPGHPAQVGTNRDFVRLDEVVNHACLVVEGLVGRFGQTREGARQITALHIAGDMADLHSVVVPKASSALQALSVTTIFRIPHDALRETAAKFPRLAEAFWRECVIDGSVLAEWVVNVGRRSALASMAHLLCEMACRYRWKKPGPDMSYDFAATQTHIGDMLGLTSVHVNRTLMELRGLDIATFKGRRVTIHDWQALVRLGDFDPTYLHADPLGEAGANGAGRGSSPGLRQSQA